MRRSGLDNVLCKALKWNSGVCIDEMGEINVVLGAELTPMRGGLDDLAEEFKCRLAEGALGILAVDVDVDNEDDVEGEIKAEEAQLSTSSATFLKKVAKKGVQWKLFEKLINVDDNEYFGIALMADSVDKLHFAVSSLVRAQ